MFEILAVCPWGPSASLGGLLLSLGWGDLQAWEQGCDAGQLSRQTHSLRLTWKRASTMGGLPGGAALVPPADDGTGWPGEGVTRLSYWGVCGSPMCGLPRGQETGVQVKGLESRAEGSQRRLGNRGTNLRRQI